LLATSVYNLLFISKNCYDAFTL